MSRLDQLPHTPFLNFFSEETSFIVIWETKSFPFHFYSFFLFSLFFLFVSTFLFFPHSLQDFWNRLQMMMTKTELIMSMSDNWWKIWIYGERRSILKGLIISSYQHEETIPFPSFRSLFPLFLYLASGYLLPPPWQTSDAILNH